MASTADVTLINHSQVGQISEVTYLNLPILRDKVTQHIKHDLTEVDTMIEQGELPQKSTDGLYALSQDQLVGLLKRSYDTAIAETVSTIKYVP